MSAYRGDPLEGVQAPGPPQRYDLRLAGEAVRAAGTYGEAMTSDEPEGQGGSAGRSTADWNWGLGIALGTGAGVVLGTALDNMALMAIGIAFFPVIAMIFRSRPKDEDGSGTPTES